nr:piggyBac transposable element-derived protein [Haemonchus contortus]
MDELNKSFDDLFIESGDEFDEGGDVLDEMVVNAVESILPRFITDEMIELIIREMNRYGLSKYPDWTDIDEEELLKFLAICSQMGLEIRSNLEDYWNTRKVFSGSFAAKLISRNRFVQILNAFHFADNDAPDKSNRLYKIQPILDMLNEEFAAVYSPGKNVCIDESMIPFRGRVIFRQYIRGKRHKFGI